MAEKAVASIDLIADRTKEDLPTSERNASFLDRVNQQSTDVVEEKFETYFGYLARCEGNFGI